MARPARPASSRAPTPAWSSSISNAGLGFYQYDERGPATPGLSPFLRCVLGSRAAGVDVVLAAFLAEGRARELVGRRARPVGDVGGPRAGTVRGEAERPTVRAAAVGHEEVHDHVVRKPSRFQDVSGHGAAGARGIERRSLPRSRGSDRSE